MTSEWKVAKLEDLCQLRGGIAFKPSLQGRSTGDVPFVKVSDMNLPENAVQLQEANNWISEEDLLTLRAKPLPPGTVVFAKIGEALRQNRLRQVARRTVIDNNMMGAVPFVDIVDARFLYYALSQFDFSQIAQGTALPYLTVTSLSGLTLKVPPLSEQRAIAHVLETLDHKIELNRRMSEALEEIARTLFDRWLLDTSTANTIAFEKHQAGTTFADVVHEHKEKWLPVKDEVVDHHSLPAFDSGAQAVREHSSSIKSTKTLVPRGAILKRFSMFLSRVSRSRLWHESLLGRSTHPHRALRRFRPGRHRGRQTVRGQPQNGGALRQAAARAGRLGAQEASRAPAHPERSAGGGTPREPGRGARLDARRALRLASRVRRREGLRAHHVPLGEAP